jgi:transcriptional regulator GlxA family with amidase domain
MTDRARRLPRNDMTITQTDTGNPANGLAVPDERPRCVGFLLIPGFALLTYSSIIEPFRAANVLSGKTLYRWLHISPDGQPVRASNSLVIVPDHGLDQTIVMDDLIVCAGGTPSLFRDRQTINWLRYISRRGTRVGAVSGGPYILARAGLLDGYRATIHWEHHSALLEEFPHLDVRETLFEIDRDRFTSSGGGAAFDLGLALIGAQQGKALASLISDWFLHEHIRESTQPQRSDVAERYQIHDKAVIAALALMEAQIETPVSRQKLAKSAGISLRQLERLFATRVGQSIGQHYLALRLAEARRLLRQTHVPVVAAAVATGFVSGAHFSRTYKKHFGVSPNQERR